MLGGEFKNEPPPPKLSASGRGRGRAADRLADRAGASLSVAFGHHGSSVCCWRDDRCYVISGAAPASCCASRHIWHLSRIQLSCRRKWGSAQANRWWVKTLLK